LGFEIHCRRNSKDAPQKSVEVPDFCVPFFLKPTVLKVCEKLDGEFEQLVEWLLGPLCVPGPLMQDQGLPLQASDPLLKSSHDRVGSNFDNSIQQLFDLPLDLRKQKTIGIVEVQSFLCLPAKHIDLLPQDQIFRLKLCSRPEERSRDAKNQLEQISHQAAS
jgi:hypothetical protein